MRSWQFQLKSAFLFLALTISGCQPAPVTEPLAEPIPVPTETPVSDDEAEIYASAIRYLYPEAEFLLINFLGQIPR